MCGIAGLIGAFPKSKGEQIVSIMNDSLAHRGPDDAGLWAVDGFAFAMRRLSIIDLEAGHQPMWTEDGVGIVFNGEIYNYRELRQTLLERGYSFRTQSDTEVFLKLYHADGLEGLKCLRGMFAAAIYDPRKNKLHLLRDRMGIKPLYFGVSGKQFFFASEIKAILTAMPSRPKINHQSLSHYLTLRFVPGPATIWEGIYKLEPGHRLTYALDENQWKTEAYWEARFQSEPLDVTRDYVGEFENLFMESVRLRLEASDVPVGVMLSGGLDSSAIAAAAIELGHRKFHTFSVAFEDGGPYNEFSYAREVANHIGARHHEVVIGKKEFFNFLPDFVRSTDEPLADLASIPLYYVSRLARQDVKVALSGEGSDEILAGYNLDRTAASLDTLKRIENFFPSFILNQLLRLPYLRRKETLKALAYDGWKNFLKRQPAHITHHWSDDEKASLLKLALPEVSTDAVIRAWYDLSPSPHPLDQLQQAYCHAWLVEDLLMKADKISMATSLELRVPFLDHRLVEWAMRLPISWKVGDRYAGYSSKRILRAFAKKRLPERILSRPKQGFPVPAYDWLRGEAPWARERLLAQDSPLRNVLNTEAIPGVLEASHHGNIEAAHKIWVLIILDQWLRCWT